jgi:hypothetical protein
LLYDIVLAAGIAPQATVMFEGAVIVGNAAGITVMVLLAGANALPQASVAVHVSVTVPPHAPGVAVNVEAFDVPLIKQPPLKLFVNVLVDDAGIAPQVTVMFAGADRTGKVAGLE